MIPWSKVKEIRRLLRQGGITQRKIAEIVGVHKGTVEAIAQGRRQYLKQRRGAKHVSPDVRCPGCGGMTQMPCMVCDRRALKEKAMAKNRSER